MTFPMNSSSACEVCAASGKRGVLGGVGSGKLTFDWERCGGTGKKPQCPCRVVANELLDVSGKRTIAENDDDAAPDADPDVWRRPSPGESWQLPNTEPLCFTKPNPATAPLSEEKPEAITPQHDDSAASTLANTPTSEHPLSRDRAQTAVAAGAMASALMVMCDVCQGSGRRGLLGPVGAGHFSTPCEQCGGKGKKVDQSGTDRQCRRQHRQGRQVRRAVLLTCA